MMTRRSEVGLAAAPRGIPAGEPGCVDSMESTHRSPRPSIDVAAEHALATRVSAFEARLSALLFWSNESRAAFSTVLASTVWRQGSLEQRSQILGVLEALPATSADGSLFSSGHSSPFQTPIEAFACLVDRLTLRAHGGVTLLSELYRLATHPFAPVVATCFSGGSPAAALASLIQEAADPARIEQGDASTCTVTSLAYELARRDPAEYVRLNVGLLIDGAVASRRGQRLVFDSNGTETSVGKPSARSMTERSLQSALMQAAFARADYVYSPTSTDSDGREAYHTNVMTLLPGWLQVLSWILFPIGILLALIRVRVSGLAEDDLAEIASSVLGRDYHSVAGSLAELRPHLDAEGRVTSPVFVSFGHFAGGPHALSVVRVEGQGNDAVLVCRNPWGSIWVNLDGNDLASTYAELWQHRPGERPATDSLTGLSFASSAEGTIRIPLSSTTGRTLRHFVVPN